MRSVVQPAVTSLGVLEQPDKIDAASSRQAGSTDNLKCSMSDILELFIPIDYIDAPHIARA
jgi:hypothetical protein